MAESHCAMLTAAFWRSQPEDTHGVEVLMKARIVIVSMAIARQRPSDGDIIKATAVG